MDRARRAALAVLFVIVAVGTALAGGGGDREADVQGVAAVTWPTSTLLISEIQTGAASASDEFVELANAGPVNVNLVGLEVVYVTATGGTITRKASWPGSQVLEPGRHLLIANSLGLHAAVADLTYSGGLAATGGTIVLRPIGGAPIDAAGWGDAVNAFVEDSPAAAPPAGSSLERRPGGLDGNGTDTNSNLADFVVQASPSPQSLAAPPVAVPTSMPSAPTSGPPSPPPGTASVPPTTAPTATASPSAGIPSASPTSPASAEPSPSASTTPSAPPTAEPSGTPSAPPTAVPSSPPTATPGEPSSDPSATPTASPSAPPATPGPSAPPATPSPAPSDPPGPTADPSPTGSPTAAPSDPASTPSATPAPSAAPTASPTPTPDPTLAIDAAKALPDGSTATIRGVLTTPLGLLEDGRLAFVEDGTGGIGIYLDAAPSVPTPAGTIVSLTGTLDQRYAGRVIRAELAALAFEGVDALPGPLPTLTGSVGESLEGRRVTVTGTTIGSPTAFADGTGLLVDDGSGPVRAIVSSDALAGRSIPAGSRVTALGPVGQRDSTGSGASGYRLYATVAGDLDLVPVSPGPTPTGSAAPSAGPSAAPTPTPSATPSPSPTPAPSSGPSAPPSTQPTSSPGGSLPPGSGVDAIADARRRPAGTSVTVAGVVTAEAGRLGTPALFAVQDSSAGIAVRLADGMAAPARGSVVELSGVLAAPYGQTELRLATDGLRLRGPGVLPEPLVVPAASVNESSEGRLVSLTGSVVGTAWKSTAHDIAFDVVDADGGRARIMADASSGLLAASVRAGRSYRLVGITGQRASRKDALDGYRIWLRDVRDLTSVGGSTAAPSVSAGPAVAIRAAISRLDASVTIEGTVTAPAHLLDATNRRIVVQDASAAIEVLLPVGDTTPAPGSVVRVEGVIGLAYGAPRLRAVAAVRVAAPGGAEARDLERGPAESDEWQLVRVSGTVGKVTRLGTRWRAEIETATAQVLVDGLPGAAVPSTTLAAGRRATVTGIVKRAYPGAADQRFSVVPRYAADLAVGGAGGGNAGAAGGGGSGSDASGEAGLTAADALLATAVDVDLGALPEHDGELVRVGGLVVAPTGSGFDLDDGTAVAAVRLSEDATAYLGLLEPGDAVNAVGRVVADDAAPGGWSVLVTRPGGLLRVGDLGEPRAIATPEPGASDPQLEAAGQGSPARRDARRLGLDQLILDGASGPAGLLSFALMAALSVASAVLRRRRARLGAARIEARLLRYAGPRSEKP